MYINEANDGYIMQTSVGGNIINRDNLSYEAICLLLRLVYRIY